MAKLRWLLRYKEKNVFFCFSIEYFLKLGQEIIIFKIQYRNHPQLGREKDQ